MVVFLSIKYFFLYFNTGCMLSYPCLPSCMCDQANSIMSIWMVHSKQAVESDWFYCKPNQQINNRITNDLGVPWTILVALKNPTFIVSVQTHTPSPFVISFIDSFLPLTICHLKFWRRNFASVALVPSSPHHPKGEIYSHGACFLLQVFNRY